MGPDQVGIVPIRTEHNAYAKEVAELLEKAGIRVEVDYADKNMNEKIKYYRNMRDPYILVVGDQEAADRTVSITVRGQKNQLHGVTLDQLVSMCRRMNEEHLIDLIGEVE
jgi:threonyl-tRNA synthetase